MKTLFISPYRQNDAWGSASRDYIKALLSNKTELTTRPYYYINHSYPNIHSDIVACEHSIYDKYDVILQKLLPHSLFVSSRKSSVKNTAIINVETGGWTASRSVYLLNRLDKIYVNSKCEKKWLEQSGIQTEISVVPRPIDIDFLVSNQAQKISLPNIINSTFKFYVLVDGTNRSNLDLIVKAFHIAFKETDRVSLTIKTTNTTGSPQDLRNHLYAEVEKIKKELNINRSYKNELIITEFLDDKNMMGLHNACDCFINLSSGSNYCIHTLYAQYLGKTPIVMNNSGLCDFISDNNGFIVQSERVPVTMTTRPLPTEFDIFTANEFWYVPRLYSLVETMQKVLDMYKNNKDQYKNKQLNKVDINQYSYQTVGSLLCI